MNQSIALIVFSKESNPNLVKLVSIIQRCGAHCDIAYDVHDIVHFTVKNAYNAILMDMNGMLDISAIDRPTIQRMSNIFTLARFLYHEGEDRFSLLYSVDDKDPTDLSLQEFIEDVCVKLRPRKFRAEIRARIHLNVKFAKTPEDIALQNVQMTFTTNLSETGCFIATPQRFKPGQILYLLVDELSDKAPIKVMVRWQIKWGTRLKAPGIGVYFEELTASQKEELFSILSVA